MKFRSSLEAQIAALLIKYNVEFDYESLKVPYVITHEYNPDFILGNGIILEAKGYWDAEDRRKIKAVLEQNKDIDLRMVFQNPDKKISKRSKTSYSAWCDKHNIQWCSYANIPIDWLRPI